jgi:hypothetical protein
MTNLTTNQLAHYESLKQVEEYFQQVEEYSYDDIIAFQEAFHEAMTLLRQIIK